jgi:hypothetical protein
LYGIELATGKSAAKQSATMKKHVATMPTRAIAIGVINLNTDSRQLDLIIPSQPSSRVDKVRYNDTMKIWDSFIHMMMDMDLRGATASKRPSPMTANLHALSQRQSAHRDEIMTKEM